MVVQKIKKVSTRERTLLTDSAIAREGKLFRFLVSRDSCLLHGNEMKAKMDKIGVGIPLAERLEIEMKPPEIPCDLPEHGFHLEFASLLLELPSRFNDRKISIKVISNA